MGFGLMITSGDDLSELGDGLLQWLVETRVEMELSKPVRYALRFEDDICDGQPAVEGAPELAANRKLGIFALDEDDALECLVYGPVTEVKSSSTLGGAGSWVEIHGLDRRAEMARVGVQAKYTGLASSAAAGILSAYEFTSDEQETLIEYDEQRNQLSQRGTDLAFLEEIARKNNMELWLAYEAASAPVGGAITLTETAKLRTSPERAQPGNVPQVPVLTSPPDRVLAVNPPRAECPGVNRFEVRIDYEKPTAARGFALSDSGDKEIVEQIVNTAEPVDADRPVQVQGVEREAIAPPTVTPEEAFLAQDAIVFEQSWFVEVDCSTTFDQAGFVIRPHQIIELSHAGDRLSGAYQVMKATHVVTATDHFMDFTARANGLGGVA